MDTHNKASTNNERFNLVKEVAHLFKDLFRRNYIKDEALSQSKELRKVSIRYCIFDVCVNTALSYVLSFMLLVTNHFIKIGLWEIGIVFFFIYSCRGIIDTIFHKITVNFRDEIDYLTNDNITVCGNKILSKVSFNIYKKEQNFYKQATNEEITNAIARYTDTSWHVENYYWFNILELILATTMFITAIIANDVIPANQFIPLISVSTILSVFSTAYSRHSHSNYVKEIRVVDNEKSTIKNDLLRVVPIISKDQETRIQRFKNLAVKSFGIEKKLHTKNFAAFIFTDSVSSISVCILAFFYIKSTGTVTLSTIAGLTASIAIFEKVLSSWRNMLRMLENVSELWNKLDRESELTEEILRIYHKKMSLAPKSIQELSFPVCNITYQEHSENDRPFELILNRNFTFKLGDCIGLTGGSGSGKSTFMKLGTGRILFRQLDEGTITPINYTFYDETVGFGSMSLYEELFCIDGTVKTDATEEELSKMQYIFDKLFLWKEISDSSHDVWQWCKEHNATMISHGQSQRLIIAKILFWLDKNIDIVALDECTSGLDQDNGGDVLNADAQTILSFIKAYVNYDRPRIVIISTHQKVQPEFFNHELYFQKVDGKTIVTQRY